MHHDTPQRDSAQDGNNPVSPILKHILANRYLVSVYDDEDVALLRDAIGKPAHWKEYDGLIEMLKRGKSLARELSLEDDLADILSEATFQNVRYKMATHTDRAYGECVYFITLPKIPDYIKIGYSTQIGQRLKALSYRNGDGCILLGISTPRAKELEAIIHALLSQYRTTIEDVSTEFFEAAPVLEWIKSIKQRYVEE